jgi:YD repeat-containing protein
MKTKIMGFIFASFLSCFSQAQTTIPHNQYDYTYDANGNRIERDMQEVLLVPYQKTTSPNAVTTLPNGLTPEQVAAGATLSAAGMQLSAYPNPANEQVTVALSSTTETTIIEARLYGTNGSIHTTLQNPGANFNVPLEGLAAGKYILWLKLSNGEIERVRVVKL